MLIIIKKILVKIVMAQRYAVRKNEITIYDSYSISKYDITRVLISLRNKFPDNNVIKNRTFKSLQHEWFVHNLCYKLHILRSRTVNVDFEYPIKWYFKVGYKCLGPIAGLLI